MKNLFTSLALALLVFSLSAQQASMNATLGVSVREAATSVDQTSLLVKGDPSLVENIVMQLGGTFKFSAGNISSVTLPINKVNELSSQLGVSRIEGMQGRGVALDDMTLLNANMGPVKLGLPPLTQVYDGSDVVLGFLDSGIDYTHPDFKNSDGTSRVLDIWDQNDVTNTNSPYPYGYGREWTKAQLDAGTSTYAEHFPTTFFGNGNLGHGSNVIGIAAGNGSAVNGYYGIAPKSDIIVVDLVYDANNFLTNVVDGANYIFSKADALGKPCVINISSGIYTGSHDATDLAAQLINNLLDAEPGRVITCSAGNAAYAPMHLGYDVTADSSFTWFYNSSSTFLNGVSYELWSDESDWQNVDFAIGADQTSPYQFLGRTAYHSISEFDLTNGPVTLTENLMNGNTLLGAITYTMTKTNNTYEMSVMIDQISNTDHLWRLITKGSGHFDLWSNMLLTGTSTMVNVLPSATDFPDIVRYKMPDDDQSIVSSYSCSDHTITTANFTNRNQYISVYGNSEYFAQDTVGARALNSSKGPTRDGRQKPDIAAPGGRTLTTGNSGYIAELLQTQANSAKVGLGGMHHTNGGTSMASPVVAGVAALYLQEHPTATWHEVADAIRISAYRDGFTGNNLPDYKWGYGKIDAFAALTTDIIYGCTDPFSLNYNPLANISDGSCVPIVFGCTDPNSLNYNPNANMNDGSCEYASTDVVSAAVAEDYFICQPNAFRVSTTFFYKLSDASHGAVLSITDELGKEIDRIPISGNEGSIDYSRPLSSGIYFYRIVDDGSLQPAKKMLVY